MMKHRSAEARRFWTAPVLTLMALGFVLGSCEYVVVAILPDIARGLNVSLGAAGKLAYSQLVPEVTHEPDYDAVLEAVRKVCA